MVLTELLSSLYELKDNASSKEKKRGAWQKLYGFLGKVGDKVGDVGVALLTKYLEQKMGMYVLVFIMWDNIIGKLKKH